jgi:hypothetical protein
MTIPRKLKIAFIILGVLSVIAGWQYVSFLFKYGYSRGSRTGVIRKVSVKGPPYCKYLEGEMALQGGTVGQSQDIFTFSVDNDRDGNPVVQALHQSEREGKRVTLDYRQDRSKDIWWRCNPNEYFVIKVE